MRSPHSFDLTNKAQILKIIKRFKFIISIAKYKHEIAIPSFALMFSVTAFIKNCPIFDITIQKN